MEGGRRALSGEGGDALPPGEGRIGYVLQNVGGKRGFVVPCVGVMCVVFPGEGMIPHESSVSLVQQQFVAVMEANRK